MSAYLDAVRRAGRPADDVDERREAAMAFHVRALAAAGTSRILVVLGLRHVDGFKAALATEQAAPLTPPVRKNVRLVHLHPESLGEVLAEPPFYVAAYEAQRRGLQPVAVPRSPALRAATTGRFAS